MPVTTGPIRNQIGGVFSDMDPVSDMDRAQDWYGRLFGIELGEPSHEGDIPMEGASASCSTRTSRSPSTPSSRSASSGPTT